MNEFDHIGPVISGQVESALDAKALAMGLISRSQWFAVEPQPDDIWEFTVKRENANLLSKLCDELGV